MENEVLVKVEGLSKKFCKDLKTSLWYGVKDLVSGITGNHNDGTLRQKEFWALKDINSKREVLDEQIDDEIGKAEQEIKILQSGASDKINKIAIETSSELIQKLIGAEVNNSSISAIVDDLYRRGGDKYYGN